MDDPYKKNTLNFPPDWWRRREFNDILINFYGRFLLGLHLEIKVNKGKSQHCVYTGFLVECPGGVAWVTAGHVIDDPENPEKSLRGLLSSRRSEIVRARWIDRCRIREAEGVPVCPDSLQMLSLGARGVDFGFVVVSPFYLKAIEKGGYVHVVSQRVWMSQEPEGQEGYCLVGYPAPSLDWTKHLEDGETVKVLPVPTCLPIERIPSDSSELSVLPGLAPGKFYGRILPFPDAIDAQPENIVGMSGGPLFSIHRNHRNQDGKTIGYHLVGIQRSWYERERIIVAEPIKGIKRPL